MSTEARFAPGEWYAVVGERATVLLPGSQRGASSALATVSARANQKAWKSVCAWKSIGVDMSSWGAW